MRYAKTEWGIKVKIFTQRYGVTLKEMAAAAGVNYPSLLQVIVGKTPGENSSRRWTRSWRVAPRKPSRRK